MKIVKDVMYVYDSKNIKGQMDNEVNTYYVKALENEKLFKTSCSVICMTTGIIFDCNKKLLQSVSVPLKENTIIRYPDNMPVFNKYDLRAINEIVDFFESEYEITENALKQGSVYTQLKKLVLKIKYYSNLQ